MDCKKYRPEGEHVWSILFKHPMRKNSNGEFGRWTRRTLSSSNSQEADKLVSEMNDLLSNKNFWQNKSLAEKKYNKVLISAFYNSMISDKINYNSSEIRENLLPLPSEYDGYKKILFIGTTGAGKTTLLRHLIGTSEDKFPLTSTAKATVSDLEVIVCEGNYKCAVNFFQELQIKTFVEECVYNAVLKADKTNDKSKIAEELFENKDQTFRLKHVIGSYHSKDEKKQTFFRHQENNKLNDEPTKCQSNGDKPVNNVENYIDHIISISSKCREEYISTNTNKESDFSVEEFQNLILKNPKFKMLIETIMNDIKLRFQYVKQGFIPFDHNNWPLYWEYENKDKMSFLEALKPFSSNSHNLFGELLSPLVEGIRIQGPFYPAFSSNSPRVVYIDGQGLGHTAKSADSQSIPKKLEDLFNKVDTILLVDNAQQPMQHAPLTAIKRVIVSGCADQLMIAFTHFDAVEGDNFETEDDKKNHVYRSVANGLNNLEKDIGKTMIQRLEEDFTSRCLFLGMLNKGKNSIDNDTRKQLCYFFDNLRSKKQVQSVTISRPRFDEKKLENKIHEATENFRMVWDLRLNGGLTFSYTSYSSILLAHQEHWTRIKALNRRIAEMGSIEYDYLRPVNDLKSSITEQMSVYLDESLEWLPSEPKEETKFEFTDAVRREISVKLGSYIETQMIDQHKDEWVEAYAFSGTGSTKLRAKKIEYIYDFVAPLDRSNKYWKELHQEMKSTFTRSISYVHELMKDTPSDKINTPSDFIGDN